MTDVDFEKIADDVTKNAEEQKDEKVEEKTFKPDLRLWVPFGIIVVAFLGIVIWTYFL